MLWLTSITLMFVNLHLLTMLMKTMHSQEVGSFSQQAFLPKFGGTINHFINRGEILMLFIYFFFGKNWCYLYTTISLKVLIIVGVHSITHTTQPHIMLSTYHHTSLYKREKDQLINGLALALSHFPLWLAQWLSFLCARLTLTFWAYLCSSLKPPRPTPSPNVGRGS